MTGFKHQVAVVTGASSGIGKAIALGLLSRGASVSLIGRNIRRLKSVASAAKSARASVKCYQADLTQDDDITRLTSSLESQYGSVDILIHSAGVFSLGKIDVANIDDFDLQYRTNVRAPYHLTQFLLPMLKKRKGQVVFINSTAGLNAKSSVAQYAATKHALKAISDSLRDEVNAFGIRVLSVYPGRTSTPLQASIHNIEGKIYRPELLLQPEDVASTVIHALSLPRTAEITDICIRPMFKT